MRIQTTVSARMLPPYDMDLGIIICGDSCGLTKVDH